VLSLVVSAPASRRMRWPPQLIAPTLGTALVAAILLPIFGSPVYSPRSVPTRWATYGTVLSAIVDSDARNRLQANLLEQARTHYEHWLQALTVADGSEVDILPWDEGVFYADSRLIWDPRPVLQSDLVYTTWLDGVAA